MHDSEELGYLHETKLLLCFRVFANCYDFGGLVSHYLLSVETRSAGVCGINRCKRSSKFLPWTDLEDQHTAIQSKYIFTLEQVVAWYKTCGTKIMPFLSLLSTSNNSTMIPEQDERTEELLTEIDADKAKLSANDSALSNPKSQLHRRHIKLRVDIFIDPPQNVNAVFSLEFPNKKFMNFDFVDVKTLDLVVTIVRLGEKDPAEIVNCVLP